MSHRVPTPETLRYKQVRATRSLFTQKNFRPFEFCDLPFAMLFSFSGIPVVRGVPGGADIQTNV
jgi:hypothetical protein